MMMRQMEASEALRCNPIERRHRVERPACQRIRTRRHPVTRLSLTPRIVRGAASRAHVTAQGATSPGALGTIVAPHPPRKGLNLR
jgi:hypothetical protein